MFFDAARFAAQGRRALLLLACGALLAAGTARTRAEDCYQPSAADFRAVYDRDNINQHYEAWDGRSGYWSWVQSFYNGYTQRVLGIKIFHQAGWTATSREITARIQTPAAREELTRALNHLGRDVAGEWAKDDGHCRINTNDLRRWGSQIRGAGGQDDGSGRILLATVASIQTEVYRRLPEASRLAARP